MLPCVSGLSGTCHLDNFTETSSPFRFGLAESRGPQPKPKRKPPLPVFLRGRRRARAVAGLGGVIGGALHAAAHRAPADRPVAQLRGERLGARRQAGPSQMRHRRPGQRVGEWICGRLIYPFQCSSQRYVRRRGDLADCIIYRTLEGQRECRPKLSFD